MARESRASRDSSNRTDNLSRRAVLAATTSAVAGAVVVGTADTATADTDEIMEIDLRDGVPPVSDAPQDEDEVVFNVHGYTGSDQSVADTAELQGTMRELGYPETLAAVTWDDSGFPWQAEWQARSQGGVFADWMTQFLEANPQTNVRILGHSMGGIVTYEMLSSANGRFEVENADTIGSYEESDAPCEGTEFHGSIDAAARFVGNYYSTDDGIARLGDGPASCSSGLPENYQDVDVSDSVSSHTSYKSSQGCVQAIVDNYVPGIDRGDPPVSVSTGTATEVDADGATLNGSLENLGGASSAEVSFEYRKTGSSSFDETPAQSMSSTGSVSRSVSGLASETEFEFRTAATASDDDTDTGTLVTFTTETDGGGGTAPTIDTLDSSGSCFFGCDFDVDWAVSDGDGDLATVESVLVDEDGGTIDTDSTDVSGGSASGTHDLDSGFSDPDVVELTVVDGGGNSATDQVQAF
jgi:hypothetical protein